MTRLNAVAAILRFVVSDTGMGIREEDLPFVFDPCRRIEGGEGGAGGIEGSGLGLSITRQLVELMGGTLSVKSKFGGGSVFKAEILSKPLSILGGEEVGIW